LLIDVSNSFTKIAIARNGVIGRVKKVPTGQLAATNLPKTHVELAVISSVVPQASDVLAKSLSCRPVWVDYRVPGGVPVIYPKPTTIGADRLANAAAAAHLGRLPAIVIDFGTAVTFDLIDANGCYLGGIIAPGLTTSASALHERTALLPLTKIQKIQSCVGKSTQEAIRIGLLLGAVGLAREAVNRITKEIFKGRKPYVIATGGDAELVARLALQGGGAKIVDSVDPMGHNPSDPTPSLVRDEMSTNMTP